jgi:hypothetical protein
VPWAILRNGLDCKSLKANQVRTTHKLRVLQELLLVKVPIFYKKKQKAPAKQFLFYIAFEK